MKNYLLILLLFITGVCSAQNWTTVGSKKISNLRSMARLNDEVIALLGTNQVVKVDYAGGTTTNFIPTSSFSPGVQLTDIFVSTAGEIFCVDKGNKKVVVFDNAGIKQREVNVTVDSPYACILRSDGTLWVGGKGIEVYQAGARINTIDGMTSSSDLLSSIKDFCEINNELYFIDRNRGVFKVDGIAGSKVLDNQNYRNSAMYHKSHQMAPFKNMLMIVAQSSVGLGHGLYEFGIPVNYSAFVEAIGTSKSGVYGVVAMDDYLLISGDDGVKRVDYNDVVAPTLTINSYEVTSSNSIEVDFTCDEDAEVTLDVFQNGVKVNTQKIDYAFSSIHRNVTIAGLTQGETTYVVLKAIDADSNASPDVRSNEKVLDLVVKMNQLTRRDPNTLDYYIESNLAGDLYYVLSDDIDNKAEYKTSAAIVAAHGVVNAGLIKRGGELKTLGFNYLVNKRIYYTVRSATGVTTNMASRKVMAMDDIDEISNKVLYTLTGVGSALSETWVNKHVKYTTDRAKTALAKVGNYQIIPGLDPYVLKLQKGDQDDIDRGHLRGMITEVLFPLSIAYNLNDPTNAYYHNATVRDGIIQLFKYANARSFDDKCYTEFRGGGIYLTLSGYFYSSFLMRDELIKDGFWSEVLATCSHWTSWNLLERIDKDGGIVFSRWNDLDRKKSRNSDLMRSFNRNKLLTVLMTGSQKKTRVSDMQGLVKLINEGCQLSPGWGGMIKNDYTGYHHHGFWANAYNADAVREASEMANYLSGTTYSLGATALDNLANYWLAYTFYSNKYDTANGVTGRFPTNRSSLLNNSISILSISKALPNGSLKEKLQRHFIDLWNSTDYVKDQRARNVKCSIGYSGGVGNWLEANSFISTTKLAPLMYAKGNRTFPYAAFQVHRHNNKTVSVKGFNKYVWDYESNGEQNFYGYHQSHGALEIIGTNDTNINAPSASASGWNSNGYDWSHIPGVTGYKMPLAKLLERNKSFPYARFCFDYFAGGVSLLNEFGMYGYRFKDVRTLNSGSISMRANKSYTFFGDFVVCVGSNIQGTLSAYPVHTSVLQNFLSNTAAPTVVNSTSHSGLAFSESITTKSPLKLEDTKGNAYYFPNGEHVQIRRELQNSRDDRNKKDTHGEFEQVYIDHGTQPKGTGYVYVISLEGKTLNDKIAANPSDFFNVLEQSGDAHIVYSKERNLYGYSFFKAGIVKTKKGVIESIDSDAMAMVKEDGNFVDFSLTHLDLGLLAKNRYLSQVWSIKDGDRWNDPQEQLVSVKLRGEWNLLSNAAGRVVSNGYDAKTNFTSLQFRSIDAKSLEIRLEKVGIAMATGDSNMNSYRMYPNPTNSLFRISGSKSTAKNRVVIYDILGAVVKVVNDYVLNNTIDISSLCNGVYTIEIYDDMNVRSSCQKIVKI
ncbi:T9SS type A sorting domain-containing protein [Halosquirtibacter xylanolyticus]|uniref:chondroitinase family polysaccharide lyase n=1 Tax=Halosquirtibacter xylanolyticus TaxID=3374599 RepID=UPI00374A83FD|nr:T9SS type A sorting domain-containing protein [Prolixibacteraceae bacterium]